MATVIRLTSVLALAVNVLAAATPANPSQPGVCVSQSQPNPIAAQFPHLTTGTVNGTLAILPVSYALARSLVPAQYPLLDSYKRWLPNFPQGMFPVRIDSRTLSWHSPAIKKRN